MIAATLAAARWYRSVGFNPIPSCPRVGHPPWPYSHARDTGLSEKSFNRMVERELWTNIQLATGVRWGLAVLDVDGDLAANLLEGWAAWNPLPATWTVATPSGGRHYWFGLEPDSPPLPKRHVWQGEGRHEGVEILGDAWLVKAPPSGRDVAGTWREYRWLPGRSPRDLPLAPFPAWLRDLDYREAPPRKAAPRPALCAPGLVRRWDRDRLPDWKDVLASIPDKLELARRWGLPLARERPNAAGWVPAYCVFREDRTPSASYSTTTGRWWEPGMGRCPITPFDLGVALGFYPDFATALMSLARDYGWRA
jgi:hypothetical protein